MTYLAMHIYPSCVCTTCYNDMLHQYARMLQNRLVEPLSTLDPFLCNMLLPDLWSKAAVTDVCGRACELPEAPGAMCPCGV